MPPISVFRCYLKVFAKMVTEIIILYRKRLQRDLFGHLLLQQENNVEKTGSLHLTEILSDRCGQ